jgi:aspartyl/asparaginyl-tRNA synthetase
MPDFPYDARSSNSSDTSAHGEETLSRGQRSHSTQESEKLPEETGINPEDMTDYMNAFRWGMPPHASGSIYNIIL